MFFAYKSLERRKDTYICLTDPDEAIVEVEPESSRCSHKGLPELLGDGRTNKGFDIRAYVPVEVLPELSISSTS